MQEKIRMCKKILRFVLLTKNQINGNRKKNSCLETNHRNFETKAQETQNAIDTK